MKILNLLELKINIFFSRITNKFLTPSGNLVYVHKKTHAKIVLKEIG